MWSVAVGLAVLIVVSLIVWAADSQSGVGAGGAMRFATVLWLAAHRTPLQVPDGTIAVAPLGLTLLLALLLARASSIIARTAECTELGDIAVVTVSVTVPYAILAAILAAVAHTGAIKPAAGAAFVTAGLLGAISAAAGALRGSGLSTVGWHRIPLAVRIGLRAAGKAAAVLLGGATLLTLGTMLAHLGAMKHILDSYSSGPGQFAIVVISLLLIPNAICFGLSYLTGIGFAVGSGTSFAPLAVHSGAVPALPVFAAVPHGRAPLPVVLCCAVVVLGSGLIAGWPPSANRPAPREQLRTVAVMAATLGVGATIVAALAGGPAGPGLLSAVGPSPWQLALVLAGEVGVVALVVVAVHAWLDQARAMLAGRR